MDKRPNLTKDISVKDFKDFYWLKEELVAFCRTIGLSKQGNKLAIANRIEIYLKTGEIEKSIAEKEKKIISKFDWHTAILTTETRLTNNYKNTENVRAFFVENIGTQFKFNVPFMKWMKTNEGKTFGDAIEEWQRIKAAKKVNDQPKKIAPQFEYNRYIRDFLKDNPTAKRAKAIEFWKIKKLMRGDNAYRKADLELKTL